MLSDVMLNAVMLSGVALGRPIHTLWRKLSVVNTHPGTYKLYILVWQHKLTFFTVQYFKVPKIVFLVQKKEKIVTKNE